MTRQSAIVAFLLMALMSPSIADQQFAVVTPDWVASHAADPAVRILDVRPEARDYFIGHVPNAVNLADCTMRGPKDGMPVQYLPVSVQAELLKRAGVQNNQTVVLYSDGPNVVGPATVAYVLERMGHPDVKIMDGGWTAYKAIHKSSQQYPSYKPGKLAAREARIYVTLADVKKAMGRPEITMIDARSSKAYSGQEDTWMRNGHIPGAINIDWHSLMEADNPHKFKSVEQAQAIFDANGVKKTNSIIVYCGTSREASLEYAVLKHLLGYPDVRLYEGSWTEYSSHPELPVETGSGRTLDTDSVGP